MKSKLIFLFIFLNSLSLVFSVVQNWDLENSAIDLLATTTTKEVVEYEENKDNIYAKLTKKIAKNEDGSISYTKHLSVSKGYNDNVYDGDIFFDKIDSIYFFDNDRIICPKGKYHPTYFYNNQYSFFNPSNFNDDKDWELKCYYHKTGYFLVFYLMNGKSQFYYKKSGSSSFVRKELHDEIYDFKLTNGESYAEYPLAYVVKNGNSIQLRGAKYTLNHDGVFQNDCGGEVGIMNALTYTRGCFEKDYDHFYFLTYSNTSDFACGYYDASNSIDYLNVWKYSVNKHEDSPLEFVDQVEIEEIKFLYNYKYYF